MADDYAVATATESQAASLASQLEYADSEMVASAAAASASASERPHPASASSSSSSSSSSLAAVPPAPVQRWHPAGLFPRPLGTQLDSDPGAAAAVSSFSAMVGGAAGKALQDGRLFPLALSHLLFEAMQRMFATGGQLLPSPRRAGVRHHEEVAAVLRDGLLCEILTTYYPALQPLLRAAKARSRLRAISSSTGSCTIGEGPASSESSETAEESAAAVAVVREALGGAYTVEDLMLTFEEPATGVDVSACALTSSSGTSSYHTISGSSSGLASVTAAPSALAAASVVLTLDVAQSGELDDDEELYDGSEYLGGGVAFLAAAVAEPLAVTSSNVDTYVAQLISFIAWHGVRRQLVGVYEGLRSVATDPMWLCALTPRELRDAVCGQPSVEWDAATLGRHISASHGYTITSAPVQMLISVLDEMSQAERSAFLRFATGQPVLPPGGLAALAPALSIIRKAETAGALAGMGGGGGRTTSLFDWGALPPASATAAAAASAEAGSPPSRNQRHPSRSFAPTGGAAGEGAGDIIIIDSPDQGGGGASGGASGGGIHDHLWISASTCFHQVKLPPYSSRALMRAALSAAIHMSAGLIDLS